MKQLRKFLRNTDVYRKHLCNKLDHIDRVNLGCGFQYVPQWLNIGLFDEKVSSPKKKRVSSTTKSISFDISAEIVSCQIVPYGSVKTINGAVLCHYDLLKSIPVHDNSLKYIYSSHFIEHLNFDEAVELLKECYRKMAHGGLIRLSCPDVEIWINEYARRGENHFYETYRTTFSCLRKGEPARTKSQVFAMQLYDLGHKWVYDFESLKDILERAQFKNINRKRFRESNMPDIDILEPDREIRKMESIFVEAQK